MTTSVTIKCCNAAAPGTTAPLELQRQLLPLLQELPQSVPQVRDRFAQIQRVLVPQANGADVPAPAAVHDPGETDGIACFNYLYHDITRRVIERLDQHGFADEPFLTRLDLRFAWRYLDALRTWLTDPGNAPRAWTALFDRRSDPSITRLQFAIAGVNAHVNYDLAFALVATVTDLDRAELNEGSQRQDYNAINDIFFRAIPPLRWHFEDYWQRLFDKLNGSVDDLLGSLAVVASRDAAWVVAERLWQIRAHPEELEQERLRLDEVVARLGAGLLI
ncbi:MAG: DUF5995 family protein [Frankiaceae bacterium]